MAAQLLNKVAIITGSSSGIGEAMAIKFASQGAKVTLCGRDQGRLKSTFDKAVKASGGHKDKFHTVQGDLNDPTVRKAIVTETVEKFGRLDVLVANAGVILPKDSVCEADEATYDAVMNTNLKSVFFLIQNAVSHLEKTKGNIINISSAVSMMTIKYPTIYAASKAALDHLSRCLAIDLGAKGIRVNVINPGYIGTPLYREYGANTSAVVSEAEKAESDRTALKGRLLTVEDIANTATFLASDSASFITGENIRVDGGRTFGGTATLPS